MNTILLALFALSSMCGLIFEVTWAKMLSPVFGNTVYAASIVVSTFMAGLAAGSFAGGRLAEKSKSPLFIYIITQLLIGVYSLFVPLLVSAVKYTYILFATQNEYSLFYLNTLRGFLSFFILLIPTSLMGMAIPILAKEVAHKSGKGKWAIGSIYSISSFGGAVGSFLTGFFIIIFFGIKGSNNLAAGLSILVSFSAYLLWISEKRSVLNNEGDELSDREILDIDNMPSLSSKTVYALLALAFISGFTALGYEILWLRLLIPVMESTTYTFSLVLTVFLFGLGLGNYLCFKFLKQGEKLLFFVVLFEVLIGFYSIASIAVFGNVLELGRFFYGLPEKLTWEKMVMMKFVISFVVLIIPTTLFGMLLPLITYLFSGTINKIGRGVGDVFYINTAGSILGSVAAGFLLIPLLGVKNSLILLGFVNILLGLSFAVLNYSNRKAVFASLSILISIIFISPFILKIKLFKPLEGEKTVFYKEGIAGNVEVAKNSRGYNILRVDNKTHGGNEPWVKEDEVRIAHFPMLLHDNPQDVLLVGLGTGITLDAISRHKVNSVDCVEIIGGLKKAVNFFFDEKPKILERENINIIIEDGRNYVLRTRKKYDLIIMDLIHPESAGAGNLFTKEYYIDASKVIKRNGFVAQWLPLHQLSEIELKIILRTFASVFPHASLWFGSHSQDYPLAVLIGSNEEKILEKRAIKSRLDSTELSHELLEKSNVDRFLDNFIMSRQDILKYTEGMSVNSDDFPVIEFLLPKGLLKRGQYGRMNYFQLYSLKTSNKQSKIPSF